MKSCSILIALCFICCAPLSAQIADVTIRFDRPTTHFTESIPVGNGRLGAMMFGGTNVERIALNEISLWSGGPQDADNDSARFYLKPIQDLLLAGKNLEAQALLQKHFVARGAGSGFGRGVNEKYGAYQTLGDIFIQWRDTQNAVTAYNRTLDLEKAITTTAFSRNGNTITEELFADFEHDLLWVRFRSEKKNGISFRLSPDRKENAIVMSDGKNIILKGQLPSGKDEGMRFAMILEPQVKDGILRVDSNHIIIEDATECVLKIFTFTNYDIENGSLSDVNPLEKAESLLLAVQNISFQEAAAKSTKIYKGYFDACRLYFSEREEVNALTTNERLIRYAKGGKDPQLPALYFNFGRYLLISSSRPGHLPANLQGLWATEYQTPWNGDYHLNINLQMNYWPAEVTNLSSLAQPLFEFTRRLVPNGRKTAKAYYNAGGWVAHVISNPWHYTSPGEGADWGSTLTGGAWLCTHIWQHYRFTKDTAFLKKYYPVLKESAQFLQSILIREPEHGWLVTAPSNSPENTYITPDGFRGQTAMGPTMDMQICREVFSACIEAASILNTDEEWVKELTRILPKLAPNRIGEAGDLNEWLHDWDDADPRHRHVSHLYGLHPYDEITPWETPELADAAGKTLEARGDGGAGWSKAWKINFRARLGDGNRALVLLKELLTPVNESGTLMAGGGTYPNLFCAHPPFQIDGNFGGVAGIAEMLLQSHGKDEVIRLLPALPDDSDWNTGRMKGLKARGNFTVDIDWEGRRISRALIVSNRGGVCKFLLPEGMFVEKVDGQKIAKAGRERVVSFRTTPGTVIQVKRK